MFDTSQYQLLDFAEGRKLERWAGLLVDRPAPVASGVRAATPQLWQAVDARFELTQVGRGPERGHWQWPRGVELTREQHLVEHGLLRLELGWTPFGHVGIFPEQAANWDWIGERVAAGSRPFRVLNLFGYTGGSTMAAAANGAEVTHVDSSRSAVQWARRNAEHSSLGDAPVRWIVDDCLKYVERESRRGRRYEAVVLDPPSYGRGPKREVWQLDEHLPDLLDACVELLSQQANFLLLTCHSPTWPSTRLEEVLGEALELGSDELPMLNLERGAMTLTSGSGAELPAGQYVRATA